MLYPLSYQWLIRAVNVQNRSRNTRSKKPQHGLAWRRRQIEALRDMVRTHGDELVAALHADLRKPTLEAWTADLGQVTVKGKSAPIHTYRPLRRKSGSGRRVSSGLDAPLVGRRTD